MAPRPPVHQCLEFLVGRWTLPRTGKAGDKRIDLARGDDNAIGARAPSAPLLERAEEEGANGEKPHQRGSSVDHGGALLPSETGTARHPLQQAIGTGKNRRIQDDGIPAPRRIRAAHVS